MDGLRRCLKGLNGMELEHCNDLMPFFKKIFHMMGIDYLWRTICDVFESVSMPLLLENHVQLMKIYCDGT